MLQDRAENFWFGTYGGGVTRYDGATWKTFTAADGLAGNLVVCMLEDRLGNLWAGGDHGGVSRYDGSAWTIVAIGDVPPQIEVICMLEDHAGNLWFGTEGGGVSRYNGVAWTTFTLSDGLASNRVMAIHEDRFGNLWFGTTDGLSRFDGTTWKTFTTADGLAANIIASIFEDRLGRLWLSHYGWDAFADLAGVSRYDGTTWQIITSADGLPTNDVTSILEDRFGNLWFGTFMYGASRFDGRNWQNFRVADGLANEAVLSLLLDQSGNVWFVTYGGVSRFDCSTWKSFTRGSGPTGTIVLSIQEDPSGNIWFGTNDGGLSRYDGATWQNFTPLNGGHVNISVQSFLLDRAGGLWVATAGTVSHYDGSTWSVFTTADGIPSGDANPVLEDHSGKIWALTSLSGVGYYDGTTWRNFTTADGLASNSVTKLVEDRAGHLWFATAASGVSRFDEMGWRTFTAADGLGSDNVAGMLVDRSGNLWFGSDQNIVTRFDGALWHTYTLANGLPAGGWIPMIEDRSGNIWFRPFLTQPGIGVVRFNGSSWTSFNASDGLAGEQVFSIAEDRSGRLWFGALEGGAAAFDGSEWRTVTVADGLASNRVLGVLGDRAGNVWFGTFGAGMTRYEPDRVPPQTVFLSAPPPVSSARNQSALFAAAFGEVEAIEFSYRQDGGPWTEWSRTSNWSLSDAADGIHVLEARSRDFLLNVDPTPARATFEIDATAPAPVVNSPSFGAVVHGAVTIQGTVDDRRLREFQVTVRPAGSATWNPPDATEIARASSPVTSGVLATWSTASFPDGLYDLRVAATDSLGLTGVVQVTAQVDNAFPHADVTAPARVVAATGGDIYTTRSEAHFYFPPHAFREDALVTLAPNPDTAVPDTISSGAVRVLAGYDVGWSAKLLKSARLELALPGGTAAQGTPVVYASMDGATWHRIGGTLVGDPAGHIALALTEAGRYAVFAEGSPPTGGPKTLSTLSFTPRVFSPSGTFADREVAISFALGRPAPVTVKIYNRAGRLVREVVVGLNLGAGANLIRWDGTDRDGRVVEDGLYLVTVEALGHAERAPLAVVK